MSIYLGLGCLIYGQTFRTLTIDLGCDHILLSATLFNRETGHVGEEYRVVSSFAACNQFGFGLVKYLGREQA